MAGLALGVLQVETVVRTALVVVGDPMVIASGPPVTLDDLGGRGVALLDRPAGAVLAFANPDPGSGLFVWATGTSLAVVADPNGETDLTEVGEITVCSGRLVAGSPDVLTAWGAGVDTGDGSVARARMHRGRTRLGLIVVTTAPVGHAAVRAGTGAAAVSYPTGRAEAVRLPLALAG